MPDFKAYSCNECSGDFKAMAGARAAENGYCSPACESNGKGFA